MPVMISLPRANAVKVSVVRVSVATKWLQARTVVRKPPAKAAVATRRPLAKVAVEIRRPPVKAVAVTRRRQAKVRAALSNASP